MVKRAKKTEVKEYWEEEACGERYGKDGVEPCQKKHLEKMAEARYFLEPYIPKFADFSAGKNKHVLEIGVGAVQAVRKNTKTITITRLCIVFAPRRCLWAD